MSEEKMSLKAKLIIGGIGIVTAAGLFFLGRHLWKKHKDEKGQHAAIDDSKSALNALQNNGVKPTYPPAQYTNWANTLQQSYDGYGVAWANTKPIWMAMKNDADIYQLITAYGSRTIDKTGWGTGDFTGDLSSTLAYKYSGSEGADMELFYGSSVNAINKILQDNGLTFKF